MNTPSALSRSDAPEAGMLVNPYSRSTGAITPPAAIAPASHGNSLLPSRTRGVRRIVESCAGRGVLRRAARLVSMETHSEGPNARPRGPRSPQIVSMETSLAGASSGTLHCGTVHRH